MEFFRRILIVWWCQIWMSHWPVRLRLPSHLTNHSLVMVLSHTVLVRFHWTFQQWMWGNRILEATPLNYQKIKAEEEEGEECYRDDYWTMRFHWKQPVSADTGNTGALRVSSMMSKWTHEWCMCSLKDQSPVNKTEWVGLTLHLSEKTHPDSDPQTPHQRHLSLMKGFGSNHLLNNFYTEKLLKSFKQWYVKTLQ